MKGADASLFKPIKIPTFKWTFFCHRSFVCKSLNSDRKLKTSPWTKHCHLNLEKHIAASRNLIPIWQSAPFSHQTISSYDVHLAFTHITIKKIIMAILLLLWSKPFCGTMYVMSTTKILWLCTEKNLSPSTRKKNSSKTQPLCVPVKACWCVYTSSELFQMALKYPK